MSITMQKYANLGLGSENDFWMEDSTKMLMDDVRNRARTVDDVAFEFGVSAHKIKGNVGKIKTLKLRQRRLNRRKR